jgi:hypothetical protein
MKMAESVQPGHDSQIPPGEFNTGAKELTQKGLTFDLPAPLAALPVHIRGGSIFTKQMYTAPTTEMMKNTPLTIIAALNDHSNPPCSCDADTVTKIKEETGNQVVIRAKGILITDDGLTEAATKLDVTMRLEKHVSPQIAPNTDHHVFRWDVVDDSFITVQRVEELRILGVCSDAEIKKIWLERASTPGVKEEVDYAFCSKTHKLVLCLRERKACLTSKNTSFKPLFAMNSFMVHILTGSPQASPEDPSQSKPSKKSTDEPKADL